MRSLALRRRVALLPSLRSSVISPNYAVCGICRKPVEKEEIVENLIGEPKSSVRIRVYCHGSEETMSFDLGSEHHDEGDVGRAMRSYLWFDPERMAGVRRPELRDDEGTLIEDIEIPSERKPEGV